MKTEYLTKEERLEFFRNLYENAKNSISDETEAYERHLAQYRGSDIIDGGERALTVRNITYEIIESQVSSDIPPPKVDAACYSEKRNRNAKAAECLLSSLRDKLPYEELNDIDERYTYIYGGSVWYAEWDNGVRRGREVGGIKLYCLSPSSFIPQPNISSVSDMEYCFLRFTTTKSELMRRYGIDEAEVELAEKEFESESDIYDSDTVTLITAFYKDDCGEIGRFVFSGDSVLSDIPRYYKRKLRICERCGSSTGICTCKHPKFTDIDIEDEEVDNALILRHSHIPPQFGGADGLLYTGAFPSSKTKIPYYTPRSFPIVIRKNTSLEGALFGQSDCEYIRPEQQAINKIESRILQKLLRAGITPVMPEDASITLNNSVFGQVIRMKPGESAAQYGKVDTTPDITQDIAEAERLYDHSKRILGISDALQGLDTAVAESGYARQLKISQASGRLESKKKMKHTAYAAIDKLIFEQYLAFADEPRALAYRDAYGRIHDAEFNRYDFLEYDVKECAWVYDDDYLFSVDLNGGAEYQREALWERNLENLKAGTLGDPSDPVTLLRYWQCQERAHYPHARENVEYFTSAVEEAAPRNFIGEEWSE